MIKPVLDGIATAAIKNEKKTCEDTTDCIQKVIRGVCLAIQHLADSNTDVQAKFDDCCAGLYNILRLNKDISKTAKEACVLSGNPNNESELGQAAEHVTYLLTQHCVDPDLSIILCKTIDDLSINSQAHQSQLIAAGCYEVLNDILRS